MKNTPFPFILALLLCGLAAKSQDSVSQEELKRYLKAKTEIYELRKNMRSELDQLIVESELDQEAFAVLSEALLQKTPFEELREDYSYEEIKKAGQLLQAIKEMRQKLPAYEAKIAERSGFSYDDFQYLDLKVEALPHLRKRVEALWRENQNSEP